MLTQKPRRSVRGRGRTVCLGDVKQTARRPKGPQRGAGRRPGPTRSRVPEPLLSRPCAPRCPRLPRAEDAQALPVNEAAAPPRAEERSAPTTRRRQRSFLRDRSRERPQVPWLPRAQWPPSLPWLVSPNRRSHRHLRISLWWERRGGGTAEGATRGETCAVSSATAARRRELSRAGAAVRSRL